MTTYTIPDGAVQQSAQNGSPSDLYILTGSSTLVMAGAGIAFTSNNPAASDVLYLTGISAQPGGYSSDVGVLGASHATVLLGGLDPLLYGGSGEADVFVQTANFQIVTGAGDMQIIGDPTGAGVSYGGGIASVQHTNTGDVVRTGLGATVHLWTAGTVA